MVFFLQLLIFKSQLLNVFSQLLDNRMNHFMFLVEVVSELAFSLFAFLLNYFDSLFELLNVIFVLFFEFFVVRLAVLNFFLALFFFFICLSFMLFKGLAEFTIFLWEEVGLFLDFNHTFHHCHWKCTILVSDSFNVDLELFLNPMQLNTEFTNDVSELTFLKLEILFGLDLILQWFLVDISQSGIFIFHTLTVQGHELNFIFIDFLQWLDIDLKFLCQLEFQKLRLMQILICQLTVLLF